jgi:hypothetical protein
VPEYPRIVEQSLAATPQFFADVRETFLFLETEYGYRRYAERIENLDWVPDTFAEVIYLDRGRSPAKIAIKVLWSLHNAIIDIQFLELRRPGIFNNATDVVSGVFLHMLAKVLGHSNDPAFLLGDTDQVGGWATNRRIKVVRTNLRGVLEGLALATRRYADAVLRGDTRILPEVQKYYTQKLPSL